MVEKKRVTKPKSSVKPVAEAEEVVIVEEDDKESKKKSEYLYAVGKRKTSIAQTRLFKKGDGKITINEKEFKKYFPTLEMQERVLAPLKLVGQNDKLDVSVKLIGGGIMSGAEAVRHGISKALLLLNQNFRKPLKKAGFLTRDARVKERKKPGKKRARKGPQWSKR